MALRIEKNYMLSVRKYFLYSVLVLLCSACAGQKYIPTVVQNKDSSYVHNVRLDSLFRAIMAKDSIYQRDSVFVKEKADTIYKYVERVTYQYKMRYDTIYRDVFSRDTMFLSRVDSISIERPVYIEKQIKWYNQGFMWIGRLCFFVLVGWCLGWILRKKFGI